MTRETRNRTILIASLIGLVLFTPRVCAQTSREQAAKAAETRKIFVDYGKKYIGCPYVSGATGPASFDCSGFVYTVARESIGVQIPRQVKNIYKFCTIIEDSHREPGDLVFFKTTSSPEASHIGIYIGNNQFLNCASDGPNTGVIVSSLKEGYWKGKYYKTGRFLPSSKVKENSASGSLSPTSGTSPVSGTPVNASQAPASSAGSSSSKTTAFDQAKGDTFLSRIVLDGMFACDWNFFTPEDFRLVFRGLTGTVHATYNGKNIKPGIGSIVRWDSGTGVIQLPVIFSITLSDYFRVFAGPVFTLGSPSLPGNSGEDIKASVFPGTLGVCFNSPSFKAGSMDVSLAQDIHYNVYNKQNGAALSPLKTAASGLVFSTGLRVTFPLASLLK